MCHVGGGGGVWQGLRRQSLKGDRGRTTGKFRKITSADIAISPEKVLPGFWSWHHHFLEEGRPASHRGSISLSFPDCHMEVIMVSKLYSGCKDEMRYCRETLGRVARCKHSVLIIIIIQE